MRSRNNALRHGLAVRIDSNSGTLANIERLTQVLAGFCNDFLRREHARIIAEAHFDMRRIHIARTEVLYRGGALEAAGLSTHAVAAKAIEKINRYERRALSRRRKALRELNQTGFQRQPNA